MFRSKQAVRRARCFLLVALLLAGAARADEPVITPLVVPPELAAVTCNPEPSGLVWSPSRRRYLVVTDDAGLRAQGTSHAPWLLGLAANGSFDKQPVPIRGVARINDAEAICAGPDGSYFLVTSHSPNRGGETAPARRQLLQLEDAGGALVVVGRSDLTRNDRGRSLLELAGLPPDGHLDIEALGFRDGALFVGLKSPLDERGRAVILQIAHPEQALREGRLHASTVARFATVPLCLSVGERSVCQGVSDMLFLGDGSLVLTANAPKGASQEDGGTLWHLAKPAGQAVPRLLRRFAGRKPEGVAFSSTGRTLIVLFDRGDQAPEWTEIPWPSSTPTPPPTGGARRGTP